MAANTDNGIGFWRVAIWGGAALLLAVPLIAMQFTTEVIWSPTDFAVAGVLLVAVAFGLDMAMRSSHSWSFRIGAGLAIAAAFGLIWVNLAVGFFADEGNAANLAFLGVLAVALIGALIARFRAAGMWAAMLAAAAAQVLVGVVGYTAGWASPGQHGLYEVSMGTILFTALWLASAWLFRRAAR